MKWKGIKNWPNVRSKYKTTQIIKCIDLFFQRLCYDINVSPHGAFVNHLSP